jgi:putative nucleotidyltransferase with HDIG domain
MIYIISLLKYGHYDQIVILKNFGFAGASGVFCLMFTITLVWIFEKLFGVTTNLSLIELSDMNSPVLKRLSIGSTGTYHHSVLVGNLAESAAEAIGANPLKTRVLAYYHDIGKINKPEYFIENQVGSKDNPHEKISPRMSALIISSHVKQGVELARKYKLPQVIMDIIREHHGTTLISFFYEKAKAADEEKKLMRDDFCYPGPKPGSKENALIMLADSVEAASRSLSEPTTSRLRGLVNKIIDGKIADGQLDNCDLTFIDLAKIKDSFIPVLTGMFHTRIEYPESESKRGERATGKKNIRLSEIG